MVVKISQTASNILQSYDIESKHFYFQGKTGNLSRLQSITLSNKEKTIQGLYTISNWVNYIPFRYLFGKANLTRAFQLYENGNKYGSVVFSKHGFLKSFYEVTLDRGEKFRCYSLSQGSFDYVSVYQDEKQIALIETYRNVNDYKYTHKLYILDAYDAFADTLSFFVLYYASYSFAKRFHMSKSSVNEKAWSFSKYRHKYDPKWRETYFPNENFFGRTTI